METLYSVAGPIFSFMAGIVYFFRAEENGEDLTAGCVLPEVQHSNNNCVPQPRSPGNITDRLFLHTFQQ